MSFDTSWNVDKYKSAHEYEEHWKFRRTFLSTHKEKYPEDRLVCLAQVFFNVHFLGCKYPQQTMDLIKNLSEGLANDLIEKNKGKLKRTFVAASEAAEAKVKRNCQTSAPHVITKSHLPKNNINIKSPYDSNYILPGFMLLIKQSGNPEQDAFQIIDRSCSFSNIPKPIIKYDTSSLPQIKSELFLQNKLIAYGTGTSEKVARRDVTQNAYNRLKKNCFIIEEKEYDTTNDKINKVDIISEKNRLNANSITSTIDNTNENEAENNKSQLKLSNDNVGAKLLKLMGWQDGNGLGKSGQGRIEPIEIVQLPKNMGLGNKKEVGNSAKQKIMFALQREVNKHLKKFLNGPKKKIAFSTEFTKDERKIIHMICNKLGLKNKSYGVGESRYLVISKKQSAHEIFQELIESNCHENDFYILLPPPSD